MNLLALRPLTSLTHFPAFKRLPLVTVEDAASVFLRYDIWCSSRWQIGKLPFFHTISESRVEFIHRFFRIGEKQFEVFSHIMEKDILPIKIVFLNVGHPLAEGI
jgi:hypothetical protein